MFGLCLGGAVGLLAGVKLGGVAAVGGSILGYAGATVVREQKELRTYIDEHYVREPELYVLSPREEAELCRRLERPSQESRHLPPSRPRSRRGPAGYRRPSSASSCTSASSLAARRRAESARQRANSEERPRRPPHLSRPSFRRLGDLSEEEQRSVMALIYSSQVVELVAEDRPKPGQPCVTLAPHGSSSLAPPGCHMAPPHCGSLATPCSSNLAPHAQERKRSCHSVRRVRTSSLPDGLAEDNISLK